MVKKQNIAFLIRNQKLEQLSMKVTLVIGLNQKSLRRGQVESLIQS